MDLIVGNGFETKAIVLKNMSSYFAENGKHVSNSKGCSTTMSS
jgi:hypothetical protein